MQNNDRILLPARLSAMVIFMTLLTTITFAPGKPAYAEDGVGTDGRVLLDQREALLAKDKSHRMQAIRDIATSKSEHRGRWLQAMLDGVLYDHKKDKVLVIAQKSGRDLQINHAVDGSDLGVIKKRKLKKISLDNKMRSELRAIIAGLALTDNDPVRRLDAVQGLIGIASPIQAEIIRENAVSETNTQVLSAMEALLVIHDIQHGDSAAKRKALALVDGSIDPVVINALRSLVATTEDPQLGTDAQQVVDKSMKKIAWYARFETFFFGLSLGSVLVVAAIGLAITFGVMGVINMAHGELIMLGAYTTYFIQQLFPNLIDLSLLLAVPAAFLLSGSVGIVIERTVIRHLYGRPLETLLATFGISLLLQQLVRTVVSPQNVTVVNPSWMSGSWMVNPALSFTLNRLVILAFCLVVFACLLMLFNRTGFGLQMRAVAQNRAMARSMGIRSARIDALTFGLGAGIAGIAGVALSQIGNVGPNLGQSYIIDSFLVVVFGGVGNLWGTLVAGMSLGITGKLLEPWSGAVLAKIMVLVFVILFIQKRPRGLFPQVGRAAED